MCGLSNCHMALISFMGLLCKSAQSIMTSVLLNTTVMSLKKDDHYIIDHLRIT